MVHHPDVSQAQVVLQRQQLRLSNPFAFDSVLQRVAQNAVRPIELMGSNWDASFFGDRAQRAAYESRMPGLARIDAGNRPELAKMIARSFALLLALSNVETDEFYLDPSQQVDTRKVAAGLAVRLAHAATAQDRVSPVPAQPPRGGPRAPQTADLRRARRGLRTDARPQEQNPRRTQQTLRTQPRSRPGLPQRLLPLLPLGQAAPVYRAAE